MNTGGGKWTVIQRRIDGSLNFYRPWNQYKVGFGNPEGEYWLGLENIHLLTKRRKYELRVDMEDFEGNRVFAMYSSFFLDSEADGYKLHVTGFTNGGAGDSLAYHSGLMFSTFDKDQDTWSDNCAATYYGACWYGSCHYANINGEYLWGTSKHYTTSVNWNHWKGYHYSLKAVSIKIRPVP
uniref:Microfibril associated protein 4 n=1 Tax=Oncorhynchus kisutch TaxID=8019 RepID=A0A8C7FD22_ONCKI